ncbi:Zn(II)2Cys6 transcription factor [Aspergillus affinis]|uniref:Zn(II)2Cys6 transcription factor n=1 Tax=Aspergillus affinis TaxID=1070780 RepID=UPI0022FE33C2|nr:fungal-specific transcription factor domain-containing protein [Aspergillus affinis]KAI9034921.1 fungal-specific transcription factor domain-containing protein [Aspergillus affinis]
MYFPFLRFKQAIVSSSLHPSTQQEHESLPARPRNKSKLGCRECKTKRVKCDEAYPTCKRCQRQGLVCSSVPRLTQWQVETPWLSLQPKTHVNRRLLQYWLEKVSQTLVIDPENNPFSFSILKHVCQSSALLHAIQSVSASHEQYFPAKTFTLALQERGKAIACLRREMDQIQHATYTHFLTIMLLALTQVADSDPKDYGKQHLFGARALINSMLRDTSMSTTNDPMVRLCLGVYLYWDMCSSFLVEPCEPQGLDLFTISLAVHRMGDWHHPMYGTCSRLLFIIANIGRYCRLVHDMPQNRNPMQEAMLEAQLSTRTTRPPNPDLDHLYEAFRNHGLVFLYRSRAHAQRGCPTDPDVTETQESLILQYAEETIRHLILIPASSYYLNFQSLPLLTAGSELTESNHFLRDKVRSRLRAIYSLNRLPANLIVLSFVEELWDARDSGNPSFWLSHMLQRDWRLFLG